MHDHLAVTSDPWLFSHPPSRLARWLLTVPLLLYACHLGRLLGHRFLVVVHRGRVTGRLHRSVVEVVRYDASTREAIVISPWPAKANWYRNLQVTPDVEIWIGSERYQPAQRSPSPDEIAAVLDSYARQGRAEAVGLSRLLGWRLELAEDDRLRIASRVGAVAFRPK